MENFHNLIIKLSAKNLIHLLTERKKLLELLLNRRLQTNSLFNSNLKKQVSLILKDTTFQKAALRKSIDFSSEKTQAEDLRLRVNENHGSLQFYLAPDKCSKRGVYLSSKHKSFACALAQRDYNVQLVQQIEKEIASITKILATYEPAGLLQNSDSISAGRLQLITPVFPSAADFAAAWQKAPYAKNTNYPEKLIFKTNRGEFVRSKSEMLIANELAAARIPYRYEPPLQLKTNAGAGTKSAGTGRSAAGRIFHPDFVVLNAAARREIVWEHFGLMDSPEYAEAAVCGQHLLLIKSKKRRPLWQRLTIQQKTLKPALWDF